MVKLNKLASSVLTLTKHLLAVSASHLNPSLISSKTKWHFKTKGGRGKNHASKHDRFLSTVGPALLC